MLGKIFSWEIIFAARYYNSEQSQISKLIDLKYTKMIPREKDTLSRKDSF